MKSTIMSRRDLDFLLHEWLGTDDLLARPRYADHSRGTVDAVPLMVAQAFENLRLHFAGEALASPVPA